MPMRLKHYGRNRKKRKEYIHQSLKNSQANLFLICVTYLSYDRNYWIFQYIK